MTAATFSRREQSIPIDVLNAAGRPAACRVAGTGGLSTLADLTSDGHVR